MKILVFVVILMISEVQSSFLENFRSSYRDFKNAEERYNTLLKFGQETPANFEEETHGGNIYLFSKEKATWQNAEKECVKYGGHLTSVHNVDEDKFLVREINRRNGAIWTWIGINDLEVLNTYVWSDGSPTDYLRWSENEPSTASEQCGHYWRLEKGYDQSGWNDARCSGVRPFVCKVE